MDLMNKKLDLQTIKKYAPARAFERGYDYCQIGLVSSVKEYKGVISAKVQGQQTYTVRLHTEVDDDFDYSCTCPMGDEGEFCKHCVAVALTWIHRNEKKKNAKNSYEVTLKDIENYLNTLNKTTLVDMLMQQTQENDMLCKKLGFQAAQAVSGEFNETAWKQMIQNAFEIDGFINYREMYQYMENVSDVVDSLDDLLEKGSAMPVISLAEYALHQAEEAMDSIDDSDGEMGDVMEDLQEIHFRACEKAKPDQEELAARLFNMELNSEWDIFYEAAKTYASVLGEAGLGVYRRLADKKWEEMDRAHSKMRRSESNIASNLVHIKETLAELSGDVEELVNIKKHNLSHAYHYLEIAEIYKEAGKKDKALEWAETGIKAFPQRTDSRLREFLANEYHRRKRPEEALILIWENFKDNLCLERYQKLKLQAEKTAQWPLWREKAIALIGNDIATKNRRDNPWGFPPRHSLLVEIFLWEKNTEAAWQEAKDGDCSKQLWMRLAALREEDYPLDAVDVYKKIIEPTVKQTNNNAYEEAFKLIKKIQAILHRLDKDRAFADYLTELRAKYKAKRNFIALLSRIK